MNVHHLQWAAAKLSNVDRSAATRRLWSPVIKDCKAITKYRLWASYNPRDAGVKELKIGQGDYLKVGSETNALDNGVLFPTRKRESTEERYSTTRPLGLPLQTYRVESLMHLKSIEDQSTSIGMMWKFEEGGAFLGVVLVT
ncbi:hypothetical protein TNCV_102161 [Trichonephila clavipes]|nr:hypothetical protein TNCV_102161 [Trichonephila clavipes]